MQLLNGDCLEIMPDIPESSVDLILCDLPYGTTDCAWDSVIPYAPLWKQYNRIIKPKGVIALFGDFPFSASLIESNITNFRHAWYWRKNNATGALCAKVQPMKVIEHIIIFSPPSESRNNAGKYKQLREYMFSEREKTGLKAGQFRELLGNSMSSHYFTNGRQFSIPTERDYKILQSTGYFQRPYSDIVAEWKAESGGGNPGETFTYNPQGLVKLEKPIVNKAGKHSSQIYDGKKSDSIQEYTGYPKNVLEFQNVGFGAEKRLHPTQKPVALLEYLIKTYTNAGDMVLDNCMGSGSTGIACMNTGRNFIGIEKDEKYYEIARNRIKSHERKVKLHE